MVGSNFSCSTVLFLDRYFIKITKADIDMLLQVLLQFCNDNGFAAISDVIMLFRSLPHYCIL